jgi:hypothetical protein
MIHEGILFRDLWVLKLGIEGEILPVAIAVASSVGSAEKASIMILTIHQNFISTMLHTYGLHYPICFQLPYFEDARD